ncbi:hypothetical protein AB4584_26085 [Vibrio splendidus]
MMVSREDDPKYQCTSCYKLFWDEEVYISGFLSKIECPNCQSSLRTLTEEEPIITD